MVSSIQLGEDVVGRLGTLASYGENFDFPI
jgi:hypothetical protein